MVNIKYVHDDIFKHVGPKVHCISKDLALGAGIAFTIKKNYPQIMVDLFNSNRVEVGNNVRTYTKFQSTDNNNIIFNMITKEKYFKKPTYEDFCDALKDLANQCKDLELKTLLMPKIGCGLDRLSWKNVEGHIKNVFDFEINIIVFEWP